MGCRLKVEGSKVGADRTLQLATFQPATFVPSHAVAPQANATTVAELNGIKIAQTIGDNSPAAAMLTPTRL